MTGFTPKTKSFLAYHHLIAIALVFFSFFMSVLVSDRVFEHLPHLEDEMAYLYQARVFARGHIVAEIPQPNRAYWQPFVNSYTETGNRVGKYPPGWPLLLAIGIMLGQSWVINALCSALTVALVYRLGREIFDPDVGVMAAGLTAFSPMALLLNGTLMGHTSALTCATLFMYAFWRMEKGKYAMRWGIAAGIAMGLLAINRPLTAVGVAAPFVLWSGFRVARALYVDIRASATKRKNTAESPESPPLLVSSPSRRFSSLRSVMLPLAALGVITVFISMASPLFDYAATGDPTHNLYTDVWAYDRVGFGPCCGRSSLPQNGGRGHTIVKGILHARFDLSLMAADLFGWNRGWITEANNLFDIPTAPVKPVLLDHLTAQADYWPQYGLSFFILPIGLLIGFRYNWLRAWLLGALLWLVIPLAQNMRFLSPPVNDITAIERSIDQIWFWLGMGGLWLLIPIVVLALPFKSDKDRSRFTWTYIVIAASIVGIGLYTGYRVAPENPESPTYYILLGLVGVALIAALPVAWRLRDTLLLLIPDQPQDSRTADVQSTWTWLMLGVVACMIGVHLAYWIGSQRYSTRYYFEALTALSLIGALPFAWIARNARYLKVNRAIVYGAFTTLLIFSLYAYSQPRISTLYRFNRITPEMVDEVNARRLDNRPVLVIVTGTEGVTWRSFGSLMAVTGPFLDDDIVVAWDFAPGTGVREQIIARFPDRPIVEMNVLGNNAWFADESPPTNSAG